MKKRFFTGALAVLMGIALCQLPADTVAEGWEPQEKILTKSNSGNPMLGFDENGEICSCFIKYYCIIFCNLFWSSLFS